MVFFFTSIVFDRLSDARNPQTNDAVYTTAGTRWNRFTVGPERIGQRRSRRSEKSHSHRDVDSSQRGSRLGTTARRVGVQKKTLKLYDRHETDKSVENVLLVRMARNHADRAYRDPSRAYERNHLLLQLQSNALACTFPNPPSATDAREQSTEHGVRLRGNLRTVRGLCPVRRCDVCITFWSAIFFFCFPRALARPFRRAHIDGPRKNCTGRIPCHDNPT